MLQTAKTSAESALRVGVVGVGVMGSNHARVLAEFPGVILAGVADPVIDALLNKLAGATSRDGLLTSARALDRVLRAGHYWVPQWYRPFHYVAYWNKYDRPAVKPHYGRGVIQSWWYDAEKAAKLQGN